MTTIEFTPASADSAPIIAGLIYDSSHELLDFMFGDRARAEAALKRLLARPDGHFGFVFATMMRVDGDVAGVELGYDRTQLASQNIRGTLNMFRAIPLGRWPHLLLNVSRALSGYVPPPSADAYYINNIAVRADKRGLGLGQHLLEHVIERAKSRGYRCVELDVTQPNAGAIRFYEKHGFRRVGQSGSAALERKFALPILNRMRLPCTSHS